MARAHLYKVLTDSAGDIIADAVVHVYEPGTTTYILPPLFTGPTTTDALTNPFAADTGIIDFYLDTPRRVRLTITRPGRPDTTFENVDVVTTRDILSLDELTDVQLTTLAENDVLKYSGGAWTNSQVPPEDPNKVTSPDIDNVLVMTQAEYDAIGTADSRTMYVIVG